MGKGNLTSLRYLHKVPFRDLSNWSVGYLLGTEFGYNNRFPLVPISAFLTRNKTCVDIQNKVLYTRVTIKTMGMGITIRDKLYGEKIGTKKQYIIHSGQFLVSKIDARNGAFGVVPDEADGAVITGNFWTFDVDTNMVNPVYLALLTSTKRFVLFAEKASNGTTNRHYLQENLFLEAKIPLPSLEEQNAIVAAYKNAISLAEQYEQRVANNGKEIQQYINTQLGIEHFTSHKIGQGNILQFIRYKETLLRWGIWIGNNNISSKYEVVRLQELIQQILMK